MSIESQALEHDYLFSRTIDVPYY